MSDEVTKPKHYTDGDVERIHAVESALGAEGFLSFCQGNAMKYLWRCNRKGKPFTDVSKAHWYICRWMEAYDRQEAKKARPDGATMTTAIDVIWTNDDIMAPSNISKSSDSV